MEDFPFPEILITLYWLTVDSQKQNYSRPNFMEMNILLFHSNYFTECIQYLPFGIMLKYWEYSRIELKQ